METRYKTSNIYECSEEGAENQFFYLFDTIQCSVIADLLLRLVTDTSRLVTDYIVIRKPRSVIA